MRLLRVLRRSRFEVNVRKEAGKIVSQFTAVYCTVKHPALMLLLYVAHIDSSTRIFCLLKHTDILSLKVTILFYSKETVSSIRVILKILQRQCYKKL